MTRIAVAYDRYGDWHVEFARALTKLGKGIEFEVVNLDTHDWLDRVRDFNVVLWKSSVMGTGAALHFKEKVFFLESYLEKRVFPSFRTIWHFESKVAQSYLFAANSVPTPITVASFDLDDAAAMLEHSSPRYVFKDSAGAGGVRVRLVDNRADASTRLSRTFAQELWTRARGGGRTRRAKLRAAIQGLFQPWLYQKLFDRILGQETFRSVYWQEFVPNNSADLRITVVGGRYAVGFWRHNRANDFRASGSGLIDYDRPIPDRALDLAIATSRKLQLDSVAFDILFRDAEPLIIEMSYGYLASAVAQAPGMYVDTGDSRRFVTGHWQPQELWVRALLRTLDVEVAP